VVCDAQGSSELVFVAKMLNHDLVETFVFYNGLRRLSALQLVLARGIRSTFTNVSTPPGSVDWEFVYKVIRVG